MEPIRAIKKYESKFKEREQFVYFFFDHNMPHFEEPLKKNIPLFSEIYPNINSGIDIKLNKCAEQYNKANTRNEYKSAIDSTKKSISELIQNYL